MSRFASPKTAQIWAERFAQCERSNAPVAQAYLGRRFALPWAISFCPFGADGSGAGQRPEARGGRREAGENSQTAGKLWCDPQKVSKDHDACRLAWQDFSDDPKRIAPGPYD